MTVQPGLAVYYLPDASRSLCNTFPGATFKGANKSLMTTPVTVWQCTIAIDLPRIGLGDELFELE